MTETYRSSDSYNVESTREPGVRPLRTIRENRQLAQRASAAIQAERRRQEQRLGRERIAEDRRLVRAGLRFVSDYTPPSVVPDSATCLSFVDCELRHAQAYTRWKRGYLARGRPRDEVDRRAMTRANEGYWELVESEVGTLYLNVAALQAVAFILGGAPLWVRMGDLGWTRGAPGGPPPPKDWDIACFLLAVRVNALSDPAGRTRYERQGSACWLKPHDLLGHYERLALDRLPAEARLKPNSSISPSGARYYAWSDLLASHTSVYLTGLPMGFNSLKKLVRLMVGAWVDGGRDLSLPWKSLGS